MAGEKRLIDANALKQHLLLCGLQLNASTLGFVNKRIDEQPTLDAVEVVRCKGCKSYDPGYIRQDHGWCKEWGTAVRAGGFCHHGERRTDGN